MIASGIDDFTVRDLSGHSSTRMLARYTHPTKARKLEALDVGVGSTGAESDEASGGDATNQQIC